MPTTLYVSQNGAYAESDANSGVSATAPLANCATAISRIEAAGGGNP